MTREITESYCVYNGLEWKIVYQTDDQHMKQGPFCVYDKTGNIIIKGFYKNNKKHGVTEGYLSSQRRIITETYEEGIRNSYKVYYP